MLSALSQHMKECIANLFGVYSICLKASLANQKWNSIIKSTVEKMCYMNTKRNEILITIDHMEE